eukprot:14698547-Ditylum_brightwellii.AAC.1
MTSYQTELTGILSALYLLHVLLSYSHIPVTTKQALHCNNTAAVSQVNIPVPPGIKHYIAADYDIVKEIKVVMNSGINMHAEWVKAHQDNKTSIQSLPLEAQLNVQADANVTSFRLNTPTHLQPSQIPLQLNST